MDILIVTLFVSLLLVVAGLVLFVLRLGAGDFEHGERLSLLPLEQDEPADSLEEKPTRALPGSES